MTWHEYWAVEAFALPSDPAWKADAEMVLRGSMNVYAYQHRDQILLTAGQGDDATQPSISCSTPAVECFTDVDDGGWVGDVYVDRGGWEDRVALADLPVEDTARNALSVSLTTLHDLLVALRGGDP
jgi:hypothetical protein